jgi:hypothetical protein
MQRSRLTTVLAGLGLACAPERADTPVEPEPPSGGEPSGLGHAAKPELPSTPTPSDPHFEGVPTQFCSATVQLRDDTLLRTQSFLQVWNELAPTIRNPNAHNIPTTEIDARFALCGSEQCSIPDAKLTEVIADYMVGVGVLIPDHGEVLVLPEITAQHVVSPCATQTELAVERHGRFLHVRAINSERRYDYSHSYYHGGHYAYDPVPRQCQTYSILQRDLVIDMDEGELELIIDQHQSVEAAQPWIELEFAEGNIVLSGCSSTLALQWVG